MAKIVVITHEFDGFLTPTSPGAPPSSPYLLLSVLRVMEQRGHTWSVVAGPYAEPGDIGILHVNSTRIDREYLDLAEHYPIGVNFRASDIAKRKASSALLSRDDDWQGPVIIKSDLNFGGLPEDSHNLRAAETGRPLPHPDVVPMSEYIILPGMRDVPDAIWNDRSRVVERFLREPDQQVGYAVRTWVFMGRLERCSRHLSLNPIVKASNSFSRTPVEVPEGLRTKRAALGLDYGKFDFVIWNGEPVLFDANRTLGATTSDEAVSMARAALFADGLEDLIQASRQPGAPTKGRVPEARSTRPWRFLTRRLSSGTKG